MKYGSVCSGIEAATVAWHPLGWRPVFFSEIEAAPRAVLAHHYPTVPLHGDFTTIEAGQYEPIDLLVGGTPCQDFSVAGLRAGIAGERGNLTLEFVRLVDRLRPEWVVWENVPGILSSDGGGALGAFLGGLAQLGYGFAYVVRDAQYFGVPQRRRRIFVVANSRDWRRAAAVLFERESLSGNPPPRREAGEGTTHDIAPSIGAPLVPVAFAHQGGGTQTRLGYDPAAGTCQTLGANQTPAIAFSSKDHGADAGETAPTLRAMGHAGSHANAGGQVAVAFQEAQTGVREYDDAGSLRANGPGHDPVGTRLRIGSAVRRLTPRECERLQGFPDDYTLIPYRGKQMADGPRYKMLGNSMAVPVMAWIGQRIEMVRALTADREAA